MSAASKLKLDGMIGRADIDDFSVGPGKTTFTSHAYVTANPSDSKAVAALRSLCSQFAMSQAVSITLSGAVNHRATIPFLTHAIPALVITGSAPGIGKNLVRGAS